MNGYVFLGITLVLAVIVIGTPRAVPWLDRTIKRLEENSERMRRGQ